MVNRNIYNKEGYLDMTPYLAMKNMKGPKRTPSHPDWIYKRGDVYIADLDPYVGSEQGGIRPVLVLQNNTGNFFCPTLIIAPITSEIFKRLDLPVHYLLETVNFLKYPSMVLLEQVKTIDKQRIKKYLGKINEKQMREISEILKYSLGIYVPEEIEAP